MIKVEFLYNIVFWLPAELDHRWQDMTFDAVLAIHKVNWRHRIYGHDTIVIILWVFLGIVL